MLDIISIFVNRKEKELSAKKDEAIIAIKTTDPNYKALRELKNGNEKCAGLISLANYKFTSDIEDKIAVARKDYNKEVKALHDLANEVIARVNLTEDYDGAMKILKDYGIVKNNKINA